MKQDKKNSFEEQIKKILIGFFIMMLIFTVLSRSVDSMAVPIVTASSAFKGTIVYENSGNGVVKENGEKYIRFTQGFQIASVEKKKGEAVSEEDILFSYELKEIRETYDQISDELKKLQIEYEKLSLGEAEKENLTEEETARLNLSYAREDLKDAKNGKKEKVKKRIEEEKKNLEKATEEYNLLLEQEETEEKAAGRAVEDAKSALNKLNQSKEELTDVMDHFRAALLEKDENTIAVCKDILFDFYYDGKYSTHKAEAEEAEKAVKRAEEDNEGDTQGKRNLQDAKDNYNRLTKEDKKINEAMNNYQSALSGDNESYQTACYDVLFQLLYKNRKPDENDRQAAEKNLDRAQEDLRAISDKWEEEVYQKEDEVNKLSHKVDRMEDGSYDFTEDLKEEEQAIDKAKRTVESAKLTLKSIKEGRKISSQNAYAALENKALSLESAKIDIEAKKEELDKISGLLKDNGRVYAGTDGIIHEMDIESGQIITGQEKLTIAVDGCYLEGKASKEELEHFAQGDDILVSLDEKEKLELSLESVSTPDSEGMVTFTVLLPKDAPVITGQNLYYKITKTSKAYDALLPLGALRQDNSGTYVLVIAEKQGILGTEKYASSMKVNVLEQDYKNAAIDGGITNEDKVITGSSKNIEEGNRVRMDEVE